jgi:hypothetical protein
MSQPADGLPRDEWRRFFETVLKDWEGTDVTVEVVDRSFGDQFEAERLPLAYLGYDDKDDAFIVGVGGRNSRYPVVLRHIIEHPSQIHAAKGLPGIPWTFEVVDREGVQTIVTLYPRQAPSANVEQT